MSGTNYDEAVNKLEEVLDRRVNLAALESLAKATGNRPKSSVVLETAAIGFDSSVFLRLATHKQSSDILDYLPRHKRPLILPGQAIQEFWNNHFSVVETVGKSLKKRFDAFCDEGRKLGVEFEEFRENMDTLLQDFQDNFGYVYDEKTRGNVSRALEILKDHSSVSYVPRSRFSEMATSRKRTKTPPGFKDEGDGDFFVWTDFLFGLLIKKQSLERFEDVILLTNDKKPDWSTGGVPHPILSAEVDALFGADFHLWTIDQFAAEVSRLT
jgi:hypothetical protein